MKRLVCVFSFALISAFGQSERGNITGVVTDSTGAPIPCAPVAITNQATNTVERVTTTNTDEYNAPNLSPGTYRIEVTVQGFRGFVERNLVLTAGATVRADAQLQVGQISAEQARG
jgi:hypothetical protein